MSTKVNRQMHDLLSRITGQNEASRSARKKAAAPELGIFFVVGKQLWIDSTPVAEAQTYGGTKTHKRGHDVFYEELQARNAVSRDVDYDGIARGRATFDADKREYYLFVDPCIRKAVNMIAKIISALNLPTTTKLPLLVPKVYVPTTE